MIAAHSHSHGTLGKCPEELGLQQEPGGWAGASYNRTPSDTFEPAGPRSPLAQPSHFAEDGLEQGFWGIAAESRRAGKRRLGKGLWGLAWGAKKWIGPEIYQHSNICEAVSDGLKAV